MDIMIVQLLGHVENMESMKMAMQREAKEEICVDIDLKDLEFVTFIHIHTINLVFVIQLLILDALHMYL